MTLLQHSVIYQLSAFWEAAIDNLFPSSHHSVVYENHLSILISLKSR